MSEDVGSECGIILAHGFDDLYRGLNSLQHRGQEAAGIAVKWGSEIDVIKWSGRVRDFADHYLADILRVDERRGAIYMGHVRYSTSGTKTGIENAHPRSKGGKITKHESHMIVRGARSAVVHNGTLVGKEYASSTQDDTMALLDLYENGGPESIIKEVPAAYAAIIMDSNKDEVAAIRDRHGMRLLTVGERKGRYVVASEDRAISEIGGAPESDLRPGSVVYITPKQNGFRFVDVTTDAPLRLCFFEPNYLCHWKSGFHGQAVKMIRRRLGLNLARECNPGDITIVTHVPTAPYSIGAGYGMGVGIERTDIFYKVAMDRSFIEPEEDRRRLSIGKNLYVRDDVNLHGHVIAVVEDSVVRGTVIRDATEKLKDRGAKKVYWLSATPPLGPVIDDIPHGCLFGVDMPPKDDFIWKRFECSKERIEKYSGVDIIHYLSEESMFAAYGIDADCFCRYCIGGPDPLK
jgi:amidophosphoribosyltransferase